MHARALLASFGILALVIGLLILFDGASTADEKEGPHTIFLNVTGQGPTAKAWYRGAPPAGVPFQEALDTFSEKGYRVVEMRASQRPIVQNVLQDCSVIDRRDEEPFILVLMERR